MRIVSLVPSWTEYIVDLGLDGQLVGRTKFCVRAGAHPESIARIGGTKNLHLDQIQDLKPDVIIASKEENTREDVEACAAFADVLVTDVRTVRGALDSLEVVADFVGQRQQGIQWRHRTESAWGKPRASFTDAYYVIWKEPLMVAGPDTYIHSVMQWWGIRNAVGESGPERYPAVDLEALQGSSCKRLLLSSEPYPFRDEHCRAFAKRGWDATCVDGEAFSWYGSRMLHATGYLGGLDRASLFAT